VGARLSADINRLGVDHVEIVRRCRHRRPVLRRRAADTGRNLDTRIDRSRACTRNAAGGGSARNPRASGNTRTSASRRTHSTRRNTGTLKRRARGGSARNIACE